MKVFPWGKRTFVMGIINITPDSFSGDGLLHSAEPAQSAVAQARQFIADGADILDLGAESSRPARKRSARRKSSDACCPF
jgi:dihydropteroate synthase